VPDTHAQDRDRQDLKNVLSFPALSHAPPDPPRPSVLMGLITLVVIAIGVGLISLTAWALITM
jgi:hypothetical protein